jgi:hypothetical protein
VSLREGERPRVEKRSREEERQGLALPSQNPPPLVVVMSGASEEPGLAMVVLGNFSDRERLERAAEIERKENSRERERERKPHCRGWWWRRRRWL